MKNIPPELQELILWITNREDIALQVRRDFIRHLLETNTLDEKSYEFLITNLKKDLKNNNVQIQRLENLMLSLEKESQYNQNPENNEQQKVENKAIEKIDTITGQYLIRTKQRSHDLATKTEANQTDHELDTIAAIKASL